MAKKSEPRIARVTMLEGAGKVVDLEGLNRLSKDIRDTSGSMSRDEARELVTMYYTVQDNRQRSSSQLRELEDQKKPHQVIQFFRDQFLLQENTIKLALDVYSRNTIMGQWARGLLGIGPVLASGFEANINLENCITVGDLWSYAGLNPLAKWVGRDGSKKIVTELKAYNDMKGVSLKSLGTEARTHFVSECAKALGLKDGARLFSRMDGKFTEDDLVKAMAKRPWNPKLKTLCWKLGESFKNFSGNPDGLYGQLYLERKAYEWPKNLLGDYASQARVRSQEVRKSTKAYKWYMGQFDPEKVRKALLMGTPLADMEPHGPTGAFVPMLSPGHIMERSKRYAVKLFLAHYHHVGWVRVLGKEPPFPYAHAMLNHAHVIGPEKAA